MSRNEFIRLSGAAALSPCVKLSPEMDLRLQGHMIELKDGAYFSDSNLKQWNAVLDAYEDALAHDPAKKLVLNFHGGLVEGGLGKATASALLSPFLATGAFPIFFVWHTGVGDLYPGSLFQGDEQVATPHGTLNRGTILAQRTDARIVDKTSHAGADRTEELMRLLSTMSGPAAYAYLNRGIDKYFGPNQAAALLIERLMGWWQRFGAFPSVLILAHSLGATFACRLIQEFDDRAGRAHPTSAPDAAAFDVVFMAAAARFDLFNDALGRGRIRDFRLFTMNDTLELADEVKQSKVASFLPGPTRYVRRFIPSYPHSILYFISGVLEDYPDTPLVGMDRFWRDPLFNANPLINAVKAQLAFRYPGGLPQYLVLSQTAPNAPRGFRCTATTHGAFDTDCPTVDSLLYIMSTGFGEPAR